MQVKFVLFKDGQRKDFDVPLGQTIVGRREDCGMRIPVQDVSRAHCQVTVKEGVVSIKDLGSANGTYVNDKRVNDHTLKPGDVVRIGPVTFTVQINGKPANIISPEELAAALGDDSGDIFGDLDGGSAKTKIASRPGGDDDTLEDLELLDLDLDEDPK